ncbi:mannosyltransferase [Nostoc sp. KVJ20]|uniref:mannosyltransferase n=1 Tax=Nostoc sp. KVJ20 TaxID=457944 RepID=UPI00083D96DE|nr:mannosyltransferase [Nostoc sp. KVJ20]ODH03263.1 mannosyltransferase [Nostoc sp. KVJ20]
MKKASFPKDLTPYIIIYSAFIVCAIVGMLIFPDTFYKFFSPTQLPRVNPPALPHKSYYWDIGLYANMALQNTCTAFYPLWGFIITHLFHPQNLEQYTNYFKITATAIFCISTPLVFWVFKKALKNQLLALTITLAYTVNPMAIFRVIGYTESLFSLLGIFFIWLLLPENRLNEKIKLIQLSVISILMALTRPVLIQIIFACFFSLITIFLLTKQLSKSHLFQTITISISAIFGYSIYGFSCLQSRGNFFAPFNDQKQWGKTLGLNLDLLFLPKSPLFDLLGLYLPILILIISFILIYCKSKNHKLLVFIPKRFIWDILIIYPPVLVLAYVLNYWRGRKKEIITSTFTNSLQKNYLFWFCIYFSVINALIVFFTQNRLASLGRYIFAVPFFFLALGYLYCCFPGKRKYKSLSFVILVSAIALVQQWINYGKDQWLG